VELARAHVGEPKLLLLDEPAAGLTHADLCELGDLIVNIRDRLGIAILLVEHHVSLVMRFPTRWWHSTSAAKSPTVRPPKCKRIPTSSAPISRNEQASLLQIGAKFGRFKVLLDFFQRLAFGFRQEEHRGNKGNHCAACPEEEHRGIPKVTNRRQEHSGDAGPDGLIQYPARSPCLSNGCELASTRKERARRQRPVPPKKRNE
jgi:hypothetical protein